MADPATLEVVSASETWLFDEATCGDVRELFRVDPSVASDMPDGDVVSMLFVFAYVKGYAAASGEDEAARDVVQIKDLKLGAKLAAELSHEEWRDQPAQFECARSAMVDEIRKRLS